MSQLFARKPIAELQPDSTGPYALKRVLGAGDLIMLAIGAVIGAGIFGAIGTAAAGQIGPNGEGIRQGAGPALEFSFLLLGRACALAGLCYAELAAIVPQSARAHAESYATPGEMAARLIRCRRSDLAASTRRRRSCSSPTSSSTRSRPGRKRPRIRSAACRSGSSAAWRSAR